MVVGDLWERRFSRFTDGYDPKNLIGNFQFGKVYRGVYRFARPTPDRRNITVKVWEDESQSYHEVLPGDNEIRLLEEVQLLKFFKRREVKERSPYHRNLVKFIEYYNDSVRGKLIMVYDLDPIDTVQNLLDKDTFTWPMRFKVACGVASALEFLHAQNPDVPYLIRNLAAAHIMLDQEQEPVLFDFSMISGGILYDKRNILNEPANGCHGYVDPTSARPDPLFKSMNGIKVAKLALQCVQNDHQKRPSMKQVYRHLMKLHVAESDAAIQGEGSKLRGGASNLQSDKLSVFSRLTRSYTKLASRVFQPSQPDFLKLLQGKRQKHQDRNGTIFSQAGRRSLQEENNLQLFSYENLRTFTNGFSDEKRIDDFQFGKLFRGTIENREVVVKMWQPGGIYHAKHNHNTSRLRDEIILLKLPELSHCPYLVKLIGYCREGEHIGVVYDLKALDTVSNLIHEDSLTWLQRVKIGIGLAFLLEFLHTDNPPLKPYIVCNIIPSHIMLDQDFSPVLIDYGQFGGGILPDSRPVKGLWGNGCFGYISRDYDIWTQKCDVYAYATVLLSLLCKRLYTEEQRLSGLPDVAKWAVSKFKASLGTDCSLVDGSFVKQAGYYHRDAIEITKLAIECVASEPLEGPTMEQVVKRLLKLKIVRTHAAQLGISKQL
ncbi:hypothetical protein Tsubulata_036770 [Turnera subulata]|uniref:Protein kinase domain-containing protein n=1 Tax=Turnera subulata TaxID=218843 RepID=A0A9Q0FQK2_9ROSI|nr:hypothetical protein Tsubulata_036770 [Turnera subulata]